MLKYFTLFVVLAFTGIMVNAQNFNGNYKSYKTSFLDRHDASLNFKENSEHNIAVAIERTDDIYGYVILQDPRIPHVLLTYEIVSDVDVFKHEGITMYTYKAKAMHLKKPKDTKVIFYVKEDNSLNLMIDDDDSSQAWLRLEKQSDLKSKNKP